MQDARLDALELEAQPPFEHVDPLLAGVAAMLGQARARLDHDEHRHHLPVARHRGQQVDVDGLGLRVQLPAGVARTTSG